MTPASWRRRVFGCLGHCTLFAVAGASSAMADSIGGSGPSFASVEHAVQVSVCIVEARIESCRETAVENHSLGTTSTWAVLGVRVTEGIAGDCHAGERLDVIAPTRCDSSKNVDIVREANLPTPRVGEMWLLALIDHPWVTPRLRWIHNGLSGRIESDGTTTSRYSSVRDRSADFDLRAEVRSMAAALEPAVAGQRVDAVVLGTVTRVDVTGPPLAPLLQWGTIDLRTETVLRGPPSGGTVEFTLSEERHRKGHRSRPTFEVGDRVIVLLDEQPNGQWALPAELGVHGVWFVEEDRAEVRYVKVPGHDATTLRERRLGELIDVFAED